MRGPIVRATLRTSAVLGIRLLAQAGTLLIVARLLGPANFGVFAGLAALAVLMGTFSTFGTNLILLREVSRDPTRRAAVLPFALSTTLLCGSLLVGLYFFIAFTLFKASGIASAVIIALGLTEMIVQPLVTLPGAEHQGHGRIATSQVLITLPLVLRMLAAIAVWAVRPDDPLETYAWGYLAASAVSLLLAAGTLHDAWPRVREWRLPRRHELCDAAGYAVLNLTGAGPAELDKTLAAELLPLTSAGVYAAGARVIGAMTLPVIAMMLSAMPRLFREWQHHRTQNARLLGWIFGATLAYGLILTIALWLSAPLFSVLFGPRYRMIGEMIRWLALAISGITLRVSAGAILTTMGKPWMRVGFEAIGLVILSVMATLLAQQAGLYAMPLALASSEWSMAIIGWFLIKLQQRRDDSTTVPETA